MSPSVDHNCLECADSRLKLRVHGEKRSKLLLCGYIAAASAYPKLVEGKRVGNTS